MILGTVDQLEAVLELAILDAANLPHRFRAIVDTGYNGCLTLPADFIGTLGLRSAGQRRAILADGNEVLLEEFVATIMWDGLPRQISISQVEGGSLLGMGLLAGYRLTIDAVEGGEVRIENLQAQV